jgi:hypothetical protein
VTLTQADKLKLLGKVWAMRDFAALRVLGCKRNAAGEWELWDSRGRADQATGEITSEEVVVWSSKNRP